MKGNKVFVKTMMITAAIGLTALMVMMFIGIKYFVGEYKDTHEQGNQLTVENTEGAFTESFVGVIEEIAEQQVEIFNFEQKHKVKLSLETASFIADKQEGAMPLSQLHKGEVVEVIYEPESQKVIRLGLAKESWTKTNIESAQIDKINGQIVIGSKTYTYSPYTLVTDQSDERIQMDQVGECDLLEFKGIGDEVWSVKVIEQQGFIHLEGLPILEGMLEIDINRQIPIDQVMGPIPIAAGKHKITIGLRGYEPVTHEVDVKPGDTIALSLEGAKMAYGELQVKVLNGTPDYQIKVGDKLFGPKDLIKVPVGKYDVIVTAKGYKPWGMKVDIKGQMVLQVKLNQEELEEESVQPGETTTSGEVSELEPGTYKINIATTPVGAKVVINGVEKGTTPYETILPIGDYAVVLKKEGYQDYSTSIIIDNSDNQNSYLYVLTPNP